MTQLRRKYVSWTWIGSNLRKYFIYQFTTRRNFIPILGIYFMTFPDNLIRQLGFFSAVGVLVSFLLEIPSSYIADVFGHKQTMIIAKLGFMISTIIFMIGGTWRVFMIWAIFMWCWFAMASGTDKAFIHETLTELGEEKKFTKFTSRVWWNTSLLSVIFIIALPFLTTISFRLPFAVTLVFDVFGLIIAFSLVTPKAIEKLTDKPSVFAVIKSCRSKVFWIVAIFLWLVRGFLGSTNPFRGVYLESLSLPVMLIWLVMGTSRLVRFGVSRIAHWIEEKIKFKHLLAFEVILFSLSFFLIGILKNPYLVGTLFAISSGYFRGRKSVMDNYFIKLMPDKRFKATMLSVTGQIWLVVHFSLQFILGFVMHQKWFSWGFIALSILTFVSLTIAYIFFLKIVRRK